MKLAISYLALLVTLLVAPESKGLTQDWGGAEDDWTMPTATGYYGPTVTECYALSTKNQTCRACKPQYDDAGQPTNRIVCAAVSEKGACSCDVGAGSRTCSTVGSCTYGN
jgi:hypothetical protein